MKVGKLHTEKIVFEKTKELLLKFGVKGWNMNNLSEVCNMSKRTLYKIIGNKEDLLSRIIKNGISTNVARIEKYLKSNQDFSILLENLSQYIIDGFDDYTLGNIKTIRLEYPSINKMEEEYLKTHRKLFIRFFEKGKDKDAIVDYADPITIEKTLHALIEYNISNCNNKTEFKYEMEGVLSILFKGIMK